MNTHNLVGREFVEAESLYICRLLIALCRGHARSMEGSTAYLVVEEANDRLITRTHLLSQRARKMFDVMETLID